MERPREMSVVGRGVLSIEPHVGCFDGALNVGSNCWFEGVIPLDSRYESMLEWIPNRLTLAYTVSVAHLETLGVLPCHL